MRSMSFHRRRKRYLEVLESALPNPHLRLSYVFRLLVADVSRDAISVSDAAHLLRLVLERRYSKPETDEGAAVSSHLEP